MHLYVDVAEHEALFRKLGHKTAAAQWVDRALNDCAKRPVPMPFANTPLTQRKYIKSLLVFSSRLLNFKN
jgi:hypothetical protein